jgi:hypothetical protein
MFAKDKDGKGGKKDPPSKSPAQSPSAPSVTRKVSGQSTSKPPAPEETVIPDDETLNKMLEETMVMHSISFRLLHLSVHAFICL